MNILAIVQARMGSHRFPGKVMKTIQDKSLIEILLQRLSFSELISKIVVAIPCEEQDDILEKHILSKGYDVFRGATNDVLDRYYQAAKKYNPDVIVRVTGDCPLIDADVVDRTISLFLDGNFDYACNCNPPTFPDGLDTEVFSFDALNEIWLNRFSLEEKEHVTVSLRNNNKYKKTNYFSKIDYSFKRWTVDEQKDLDLVSLIFESFKPNFNFKWADIINFENTNNHLFNNNSDILRNSGNTHNKGQRLWLKAKKIIPGGNMLLSKRSEMFLPDLWPSYFSKAKGCFVWDLDGNKYKDLSLMGVGTNILGYANEEVDDAVRSVIDNGNMTTLNAPEEVYLAEKLINMHPFAEMVRFCRTGGEANAVAVRIARAASGKDKIAFCGYHGWHDWYLAANLSQKSNLKEHLLPGLEPNGVPKDLVGSVYPFNYNNLEELKSLISKFDIGTIKMEVSRNDGPTNNFLSEVRDIATKNNIILIFDECTSGFRETFGGLHKKYSIEPDMAVFGKALGNGYAITSIIGKKDIMEFAQTSFISSTFWTERIGSTAGLKTLEVMENNKTWDQISEKGRFIKDNWKKLADKHNIDLSISGLDSLCSFSIKSKKNQKYKTFITQEMLSKGFLASDSIYVSMAHSASIIEEYFDILEPIFKVIAECENGRDIDTLLNGPVSHSGFKRLN